jgi:hypothetical protein
VVKIAYTPGPWRVKEGSRSRIVESELPNTTVMIAQTAILPISIEEAIANARLIAQAPAMLKTLKAILPSLTDDYQKEVGELISKIEGREGSQ